MKYLLQCKTIYNFAVKLISTTWHQYPETRIQPSSRVPEIPSNLETMCDSVTATVLATSTTSSLQSCWIVYTNNQGTERLVVTRRNNASIDNNLPCGTAASTNIATSKLSAGSANFSTSSHISNPSGGVTVNSIDAVAGTTRPVSSTTNPEAALDYKSLNSILDDNLRPLTPIPGNSRSEQIHDDHKKLVQEYWEIQTQIVTSQALRDNLQANMPPEELRLKKEYLKKLEEKEALMKFKATLQQQLDERRRQASSAQVHTPTAVRIQQNQHQQSGAPSVAGSPARHFQRQDSSSDSTWVMINRTDIDQDQTHSDASGGNNPS